MSYKEKKVKHVFKTFNPDAYRSVLALLPMFLYCLHYEYNLN